MTATRPTTALFEPAQLAGLPAPVVRYFTFALTPGLPLLRGGRLEQLGEFALRPGAWRPMRAEQRVSVSPPAFEWRASIRLLPGVVLRVHDGYASGRAWMRAALGGVIPVMHRGDTPGLAEGALLRWLAEAPGIPTALLPGAGVRWEAIDDATARATITDAGLTVSMDAHFGARGEIVRVTALRHRDVKGIGVPTPFEGRCADYQRIRGMMVPTRSEAAWLLPEGAHAFWRARLARATYEPAA